MEKRRLTRRDVLKGLTALTVAAGAGEILISKGHQDPPPSKPLYASSEDTSLERQPERPHYAEVAHHDFFDDNHEFLSNVTDERGEWSQKQRKKRRRTLENGEHIFDDVGMSFYLVEPGDTISEIRERLSRYPEYEHLATQRNKLDAFNIPASKLRADMWLPIPVDREYRRLSEAQFCAYAVAAVEAMGNDETYGNELERILKNVSQRELIATMFAIAKQEGGGQPLGQFELHRWEHRHLAFSFSYFHVLMKGPGLRARRELNLTEGQLYHPINAVKLFLAFLVEKCAETKTHPDRFFPILDHQEAFARFYNGKRWKQTNPHYLENIRAYYDEADRHLSEDGARWKTDASPENQTRE